MAEPEAWLRGPVVGIDPMLQPVAHALIQCRAEVRAAVAGLDARDLAQRPGEIASIDYHVRHAMGSLDRLFTYARGESLSDAQRTSLTSERTPGGRSGDELITAFDAAVERALAHLRATQADSLLDPREVGRAKLPSNVLGLLFHAAEHTQRHTGQLVTTAKLLRATHGS